MEIGILVAIFLLFITILATLWWFNQRLKGLVGSKSDLNKTIGQDIQAISEKDKAAEEHIRWTWDEYFVEITKTVAGRSTCDRGRTSAIIVKNNRILTTGYAGSPAGLPHCDDVGHEFKKTIHEDGTVSNHCVRTIHAEMNAMVQAARYGIAIDGATLYISMTPCYTCAKMLINAGIKRVVALKDYHAAEDTKRIFEEAGIDLEIFNKNVEEYGQQ